MFDDFELNVIHFMLLEKIEKAIRYKFYLEKALSTLDSKENLFFIYSTNIKCVESEICDLNKILVKTGEY